MHRCRGATAASPTDAVGRVWRIGLLQRLCKWVCGEQCPPAMWWGGHGAVAAAGAHANDRIVPCHAMPVWIIHISDTYRYNYAWPVLCSLYPLYSVAPARTMMRRLLQDLVATRS